MLSSRQLLRVEFNCIICLQMIKQSKINSFIGLIQKAHSKQNKQSSSLSVTLSKKKPASPSTEPVFDNEMFAHQNNFELENLGLHCTQGEFKESFRERITHALHQASYEKKKEKHNLYAAYRRSLEQKQRLNKSQEFTTLNDSHHLFTSPSIIQPKDEVKNPKKLSFPISRSRKSVKCQQINYRLTRKRQLTSPSPLNQPSSKSPSKRVKTEGVAKDPQIEICFKYNQEAEEDKIKSGVTGHHPIFRVKKCPVFSFENELAERIKLKQGQSHHKSNKMQQELKMSWKSISAETSFIRKSSSKPSNLKRSRRYLKKLQQKTALALDDSVDPWQHDEREASSSFYQND